MAGPSRFSVALAIGAVLAFSPAPAAGQSAKRVPAEVDRIFARWTPSTPGCSVGVAVDGRQTLARAYGMADLEHDVRNAPETIFEAGSVSKQFTAAAVLLLAREGRLSLDDPARKYVPELPDYGTPLTIRQMLTHTSGLRDWGSVAAIAGWPRTTRVHTHAHVLDIVSRQRALNFTPGTRWSYSNTGYNLAAIIVARASGMSFAEFTRRRIFEPLGMTRTSWRDDHTRILKGRAMAYSDESDGFHTLMPFENVHGNGGLLTTVGDLLKWNENMASPRVGDVGFVAEQQQPGRLHDGRAHGYALGLFVGSYKGVREISHGGATAGYRTFLARYPDQRIGVAVLCNGGGAAAKDYAHAVAELYLQGLEPPAPSTPQFVLTSGDMDGVVGLYRNMITGAPLSVARDTAGVRANPGPALVSLSGSRFVTADGGTWEFEGPGLRVTDAYGSVESYERVAPATPTQLQELVGTYRSDDAETVMTVAMDGGELVLKRRPDAILRLTSAYRDAFDTTFAGTTFGASELGTVIFRRDDAGRVKELSIVQERVWDLRFSKIGPAD